MKYILSFVLFIMAVFYTSCGGQNKTNFPKENSKYQTKDTATSTGSNGTYHTKYEYTDSSGKQVIIENSYPKGGSRYTNLDGDSCTYAVFFTRIINKTDNPLELKINFPANLYEHLSMPGQYFRILLPPDTMTLDKAPLFNYGLKDLKSFFDASHHKPTSLGKTINSNESSCFYVVMLKLRPKSSTLSKGAIRPGFTLKEQNLYYSFKVVGPRDEAILSDIEIPCGTINLNLKPLK